MGKVQTVLGLSDVNYSPESYRVHFLNGTHVDACAEHRWATYSKSDKCSATSIRTTREIYQSVMNGVEYNHQIPATRPIEMDPRELLVDPYILGIWLGGKFTTIDNEIIESLRLLGKHIPLDYKLGSIDQRMSLLQGLMDSDGTINKSGNYCTFYNTNKSLVDDVFFIVSSLGMIPKISSKVGKINGEEKKTCYEVRFTPNTKDVFKLSRKRNRINLNSVKFKSHTICKVEPIESKPMMCISVSGDSHLYLINESLIPTHNTELLCYCLWRWALTNPNSINYYFAPFKDQINELVWSNGRLPYFLPDHIAGKYIKSINNTEKRIVFKNGAYIKADGSDNYEKARGYSALGFNAYDETKDFHKQFHVGFNPNRAIIDAPMLAVGTPGDGNDLLSNLWDFANREGNHRGAAFRAPTHLNPHISEQFLKDEREMAIMKGELETYLIEYEARRIKLGTKFIFPMLSDEVFTDYDKVLDHLKKYRKDYDFFISADPGSAKVFAVVFGAIHRFEKHIVIIDEIYEERLGENSVKKIAPRILKIVDSINQNYDDWSGTYDNAATWFFSELQASYEDFPINFMKCEKDIGKKQSKLSLIKDGIISSTFKMTRKCKKLYWEMENYKQKNGEAVKENDHAIDALRYLYNLAGYSSIEEARPLSFTDRYPVGTIEEDFTREDDDGYRDYDDWIGGVV